jgi:hypothetical protein
VSAAPSQTPEAAGLEVVCWSSKWTGHTGQVCRAYHEDRDDAEYSSDWMEGSSEPLVTAASAQAAIDEQEETIESLKRLVDQHYDRAAAAEARADRLADIVRLLDECIWFNPDTQTFEVNHDGSVEKARAALQQETQP